MEYISFSGKKYSSIKEYIQKSIEGNVPWITFKDLGDFEVLYQKGLLRESMQIRTSDKGIVDQMYQITKDGKLEGIVGIPVFAGKKGVHNPKKILNGWRISAGWSIYLKGKFQYNFENGPGGI